MAQGWDPESNLQPSEHWVRVRSFSSRVAGYTKLDGLMKNAEVARHLDGVVGGSCRRGEAELLMSLLDTTRTLLPESINFTGAFAHMRFPVIQRRCCDLFESCCSWEVWALTGTC